MSPGLKEEHMKRTKGEQGSNLTQYGAHMETLLNAVKEAHKRGKFSEMPRGKVFLISTKRSYGIWISYKVGTSCSMEPIW